MAGVTTALALGAMGVGGAMNAKSQQDMAKRAAAGAQFNPWNVSGAGGVVDFSNGQINANFDRAGQFRNNAFQDMFMNIAGGGGFGQQAAQYANDIGTSQLAPAFWGAQEASQQIPVDAANLFSQYSADNAAFGQNFGMNALAQASNFGGKQTGINEGLAQGLFSQAQNAFSQDFSGIAADQLARSRQLARPAEERAVNAKFQNLFNRGALSSTGGERQIGELALAQEQADINRQFGADQFANQLLQQNRQFGLNAIGQGLQGRSLDQNFNLGAGQLFAGMGQNALNFGQNAGLQGLNAQFGLSDMINSRGQQRLANVQNLLGFGNQLTQSNLNQMLGIQGGMSMQNADLRNLIALGINAGGQGAAAGANAGNLMMQGAGSPFGSFLEGIGGGYMGMKG